MKSKSVSFTSRIKCGSNIKIEQNNILFFTKRNFNLKRFDLISGHRILVCAHLRTWNSGVWLLVDVEFLFLTISMGIEFLFFVLSCGHETMNFVYFGEHGIAVFVSGHRIQILKMFLLTWWFWFFFLLTRTSTSVLFMGVELWILHSFAVWISCFCSLVDLEFWILVIFCGHKFPTVLRHGFLIFVRLWAWNSVFCSFVVCWHGILVFVVVDIKFMFVLVSSVEV